MTVVKNEKGNTLLIVLLMVVIFTTIGLSLLGTTLGGSKRTDIREADIQSTELAEKGIDYITALIQTKTPDYSGLPVNEFNVGLNTILKDFLVAKADSKFLSSSVLPSEKGSLKVKVYYPDVPGQTNQQTISKVVTMHSEATVNGETKTLISTIHLGAKALPDAFKYALGAYNPCKGKDNCVTREDDGNMFLHGGAAIKGDLFVEGNLITRNKGIIGRETDWISSDLPSVEGENGNKANLILGKDLYRYDASNDSAVYSTHIDRTTFTAQNRYEPFERKNVSSLFTAHLDPGKQYVPLVDRRVPYFLPIDIDGQRAQYKFTHPSTRFPTGAVQDGNFNNVPHQDKRYYENSNTNVYVSSGNPVSIEGSYIFKRLSTAAYGPGSLNTFTSSAGTVSKLTFKEGAYIGGNLRIGKQDNNPYAAAAFEKFEIDGPIFVDGDLTIWGTDIKFNSTVYVTGKTTIRYSKITGIPLQNNKKSSLVLFGKKPIQIGNINTYDDSPGIIRGFFYTEDVMEMYGVWSNILIEGGIFGRKVILNAVKGPVKQNSGLGEFANAQTTISPAKSRLQIIYNPDLIANPPDGLPRIRDLSMTILERKIE